jgi:hypothetical protein
MLLLVNSSSTDYTPYALRSMAQQPPWPSCSDSFSFLVLCNEPYESCKLQTCNYMHHFVQPYELAVISKHLLDFIHNMQAHYCTMAIRLTIMFR